MLFNSWVFPPFFLAVLLCYHLLGRRWQNRLLLVASYVFYGYWDWRFLSLIALSTVIDYTIGLALERERSNASRQRLVAVSCFSNLGLLGVFKYYDFFVASLTEGLEALGVTARLDLLDIVLPVGISFYTFQTMSYTIDVYRRQLDAERDFVDFALFVSYFPQLVAGPIERASNLLPQIRTERRVTSDNLIEGGWLILKGFFLKMVIADNLALVTDEVFSSVRPASAITAGIGVLAFTFQIYGDFAGYSKIARGVSLLLGIRLMRNFQMPYLSQGPSEFWTRWHISLSSWLRDYLYIPLGGNRGGTLLTYRNLMLTMLLGGLWHGAAWTFIAWGLYQGLLLVAYRAAGGGRDSADRTSIAVWSRRAIFFLFTCFGWLLFRAESFAQVLGFLQALTSFDSTPADTLLRLGPQLALFVGMVIGLDWISRDRDDPRGIPGWGYGVGPLLVSLMLLAILALTPLEQQSFVYFQF